MKIREIRRILPYQLRALCIENNWYTRGDCEEYEHLLCNLTDRENLTTEDILAIAEDIAEHSNLRDGEGITAIMFEIARISNTFFEEVK